jgi:hypothetical protein
VNRLWIAVEKLWKVMKEAGFSGIKSQLEFKSNPCPAGYSGTPVA